MSDGPANADLDLDQLQELREDLGPEFATFVKKFLETAARTMEELGAAVRERNASTVATRAHSLKGTSSYLGAVTLTSLLGTLQRTAEAGDLDAAAGILLQAREAYERIVPALAASVAES